jgi:hypothetical protein
MATDIEELARRITADPELRVAHDAVAELEKAGRTPELVRLWRTLVERHERGEAEKKTCEAACDVIVEALALSPGGDRVEALVTLLSSEATRRLHRHTSSDLMVRGVASRLGYGQPKEALLAALAKMGGDASCRELLACWMHEVVLSGNNLDRDPVAQAFQERLAAADHPLGTFPLHLLDAEREAPTYMPMYGAEAIQKAVRSLESGPSSTRTVPPPADYEAPRASAVDDPDVVARLREAVRPWVEASKGRAEARVFTLAPPIRGSSVGRWLLRSLPIESTRGGTMHVVRVAPDTAWGALFAAASNGGAYSTGIGGAYGRKAAWTSFAALVGAAPPATREDVERIDHASASATFLMYRGTEFFFEVAWDVGIAAVRPDGASVAVLAATDTD